MEEDHAADDGTTGRTIGKTREAVCEECYKSEDGEALRYRVIASECRESLQCGGINDIDLFPPESDPALFGEVFQ